MGGLFSKALKYWKDNLYICTYKIKFYLSTANENLTWKYT